MKESTFYPVRVLLFLVVLVTAPAVHAAETQALPGPVAVMPETTYEFPDTVDGEYVVHDFAIRNEGTSVLNVQTVKTT